MGIREIIELYPLPRDYFEEATLDREEALRLLSLLDDPPRRYRKSINFV